MDWDAITSLLSNDYLPKLIHACVVLAIGYVLGKSLSLAAAYGARRYVAAQGLMIVRRTAFWLAMAAAIASALAHLGFDASVLLGAAGILTVAAGFASQTSASNLISGLFLIAERPFVVGDAIKVGDTTGEVLSVDLLSVKLRTFDNVYVRVPNESLIKSEIVNFSRFPIRRIDVAVSVARHEDIGRVREVLMQVAEEEPLCLAEPSPLFIFLGFGESALNIQFSVWAQRENFLVVKNGIQEAIKRAFDACGITIPFPQRDVHVNLPEAEALIQQVRTTGTP